MKLYRMIKRTPLSTGHKYGDIIREGDLRSGVIAILVAKDVLTPVNGPPLGELPGWTTRAERLGKKLGICTVGDFIAYDNQAIVEEYGYRLSTIERWKEEAMKWLIASAPKTTEKRSG